MCWMALIPIAIGAVGGLMQGQANVRQADADAEALRKNAVFLSRAAGDAKARGRHESDWARIEGQQLIGSQRAAMAGSGGVVDTGTNAILQQDAAQLTELDALTISNNAAREAYGYEVQAWDNETTARTGQKNARNGMLSSILGGALGGASSSMGGMFGGGGGAAAAGASSAGIGLGTRAALQGGTSRLNYNQAYA